MLRARERRKNGGDNECERDGDIMHWEVEGEVWKETEDYALLSAM